MPVDGNASVFLVLCGDARRLERLGHQVDNGKLEALFNAVVDAAPALQTLIWRPKQRGLAAVRSAPSATTPMRLRRHRICRTRCPIAGLCVGNPAAAGHISMRLPLEAARHNDRYDDSRLD
jgi:hypothetical protein